MGGRELVRRTGGKLVRARGSALARHDGAPAASTAHVSFAGHLWSWSDVPAPLERAARRRSTLVAESACLGETVLDGTGQQCQLLRAWRAYLDAVVVLVLVRPVVPGPARQLLPVGEWRRHLLDVRSTTGAPRRRTGVVTDPADEPGPAGASSSPPPPAPAQASGADAMAYLPAVVRGGADRLVPDPVWWLGTLHQRSSSDGLPAAQGVTVLRADDRRAIVVRASRALPPLSGVDADGHARVLARLPWTLEQVQLELASTSGPIPLPS